MLIQGDHLWVLATSTHTPAPMPPTPLENVDTIVGIIGTLVTAAAVIIGGVWAYFQFVKNRTYRPRLDVSIAGAWVETVGAKRLHLTVSVKNIGASMIELLQEGTGLSVDPMRRDAGIHASWSHGPALSILTPHEWIEPGETVSDDLIAPLMYEERPVRAQVQLMWKWAGGRDNIQVWAHKIIWPHDVEPKSTVKE